MKKRKQKSALDRAIAVAGNPTELARLLKTTKQAVFGWQKAGAVPHKRVLDVERLTGISRFDLAPDVCGDPPVGWMEQLGKIRAEILKKRRADAAALWGE